MESKREVRNYWGVELTREFQCMLSNTETKRNYNKAPDRIIYPR